MFQFPSAWCVQGGHEAAGPQTNVRLIFPNHLIALAAQHPPGRHCGTADNIPAPASD